MLLIAETWVTGLNILKVYKERDTGDIRQSEILFIQN